MIEYEIGIPNDSIIKYETALKTRKIVLIFHRTPDEAVKVTEIVDMTSCGTIH